MSDDKQSPKAEKCVSVMIESTDFVIILKGNLKYYQTCDKLVSCSFSPLVFKVFLN